MTTNTCPSCGRPVGDDVVACVNCGHAFRNGEAVPDGKLPPDLLAWARQTFDEAEFLAEVREVRATGDQQFEDFIGEIEARGRARE